MAIVSKLTKPKNLKDKINKVQAEVACTYQILTNSDAIRTIQIETYKKDDPTMQGSPTQIVQFTPDGLKQFIKIAMNEVLLK